MKKVLLLSGVLLLLLSAAATAAPLLTNGSLDQYIALGAGGGQIGDKLFFNFSYSGSGSGGAVAIPASGVNVIVLDTPFNPGLQFTAEWSVGPGQTLDSLIQYSVLVLPGGAPITDISASMAGFGHVPNGIVSVAETTSFGNLLLHDDGGTVSFAEVSFGPTMGPISLAKDIAVNGNLGVAAVSSVTNRFSEENVPEPATLLLLGAGLAGLGGVTWRRQHRG